MSEEENNQHLVDKIQAVTMYIATDGSCWINLSSAINRQRKIEEAAKATEMLKDGMSIGSILESLGREVDDGVLYRVTKDSKFVIEHWQCSKEAAYSPVEFRAGLCVFVYGGAASGLGRYGNEISINELIRHAKGKG